MKIIISHLEDIRSRSDASLLLQKVVTSQMRSSSQVLKTESSFGKSPIPKGLSSSDLISIRSRNQSRLSMCMVMSQSGLLISILSHLCSSRQQLTRQSNSMKLVLTSKACSLRRSSRSSFTEEKTVLSRCPLPFRGSIHRSTSS